MNQSAHVAAVISDTDILVHMVKGGIFEFVQSILDCIYIAPKVEEELSRNHAAVYNKLRPLLDAGEWLRRTKAEWAHLSVEQRRLINETKARMRAKLDPGELDCYAYSVGMGIDAIISNDKDAKEQIAWDSANQKVVITFWDLLILAAKLDKLAWSDAERYYHAVVERCGLKLPPFRVHVQNFDQYCGKHPWVQSYLTEG